MKLWRKMAKKRIGDDGQIVRNGRQIKRMMMQLDSKRVSVTPNGSISIKPGNMHLSLLEQLLERAGFVAKGTSLTERLAENANETV